MGDLILVDDQPELREVLAEALEIQGMTVHQCSNGKDALEILQANKSVKLMITDIIMPGLTGLSLIKESKKINPNLKIIAISGGGRNSAEDYLNSANHLGVDKTFLKPFDIFKVCDKAKKLIE